MTQSELKAKVYSLVREYFGGATVTWGMTKGVSPSVPQVVLNMGAINRHYQPLTGQVGGVAMACYPSQTVLQIDLYTKGAAILSGAGIAAAYENTAVNDLTDFLNFLNSPHIDVWSDRHDVSLLCRSINDLTELINDTTWDYRAMLEIEIRFVQRAVGHTGIMSEDGRPFHDNGRPKFDDEGYALDRNGHRLPLPPLPIGADGRPIYPPVETPSGGRTPTLAGRSTGWFERVEDPIFEKEE